MKILVTPTSLCRDREAPSLDPLRAYADELVFNDTGRPMTEHELIEALPGVDAVVAGLDDYTAAVLRSADALRVISRYGVGVNNIDLAVAAERGVVVTRTPGANALAVAELAIGLTFSAARSIPRLDAGVRAGDWVRGDGLELTGRTFGVIGFGAIGRLVAERARGIGMRVVAYDPMLPDAVFEGAGVERADLDDLCRASDVVSAHVPLLDSTRHLLDARRLALLRPDAIVINTARGGLLDEAAALAALESGHLHAVAIDVYETEPPSASVLVGHPRVISTPHSGAHTREAIVRTATQAVADVLAVLRGQATPNAVTT
ncbi:phosphoglycerate dehydrogenase [Microbacterium sp. HA-8]|uniref:phosphoglycerate dehydrogenase n=1 Tax=Microbacterium sp. HA-8 TaxID=3234200 RepID=UPI0038F676E7